MTKVQWGIILEIVLLQRGMMKKGVQIKMFGKMYELKAFRKICLIAKRGQY